MVRTQRHGTIWRGHVHPPLVREHTTPAAQIRIEHLGINDELLPAELTEVDIEVDLLAVRIPISVAFPLLWLQSDSVRISSCSIQSCQMTNQKLINVCADWLVKN